MHEALVEINGENQRLNMKYLCSMHSSQSHYSICNGILCSMILLIKDRQFTRESTQVNHRESIDFHVIFLTKCKLQA